MRNINPNIVYANQSMFAKLHLKKKQLINGNSCNYAQTQMPSVDNFTLFWNKYEYLVYQLSITISKMNALFNCNLMSTIYLYTYMHIKYLQPISTLYYKCAVLMAYTWLNYQQRKVVQRTHQNSLMIHQMDFKSTFFTSTLYAYM